MRKTLKNKEFLDIINKESSIYKCPVCKKEDWAVFSKHEIDDNKLGSFGYASYIIEKDNVSLAVESPSITFALAVCQNCGFMANFDESILIKRMQKLHKNRENKGQNAK